MCYDNRQLQTHPQARSYRSKSIPNYKHLELIFGSAIIDGSPSNDLDKFVDEDVEGPKAGA